ncbi:MAG TPA: peptide deformylase [Bacteroidia bacterium]|nr:peptide deformylase [Bacteroidia bacterium]
MSTTPDTTNTFDFQIIPDEQTPKLADLPKHLEHVIKDWAAQNAEKLDAFLKFAYKLPNTVGLASNQCALNGTRITDRFFAFHNQEANCWEIMINPRIDKHLGHWTEKEEGCKTWYGKLMAVNRAAAVMVTYYDIHGDLCEKEIFKGFTAQIIQHETDHLNGVHQNMVEGPVKLNIKPKPQRNDACPCGSEKKFKNCCWNYTI